MELENQNRNQNGNDKENNTISSLQPALSIETCENDDFSKMKPCESESNLKDNIENYTETENESSGHKAFSVNEFYEPASKKLKLGKPKLTDDIETPIVVTTDEIIDTIKINTVESNDEGAAENNEECLISESIKVQIEKTSAVASESEENKPCITITFNNNNTADLYKKKFLSFISTFKEFELNDANTTLNIYKTTRIGCDELGIDLISRSERGFHSNRKKKKKSKARRDLFIVDPNPSDVDTDVRYVSMFNLGSEAEKNKKRNGLVLQTCFNCNMSHMLKDCPQPKDFDRIALARQKLRTKPPKSRYHLECDQKYNHFTPGKISENLREAMGLKKNEIPPYVYLMRVIGYPPGWFEEAKIVHSNLEMFGIEGDNVKTKQAQEGLDYSKIVDYPGFNVPMDVGVKDDFKSYGVPPFDVKFSKNAMIKYYEEHILKNQDSVQNYDENETTVTENDGNKEADGCDKQEREKIKLDLTDLEDKKKKILDALNETREEPIKLVKSSSFGTPILKSNSAYGKLPNPENFSKDVSPVINFENLPNSTGKYEQMSNVLSKVRIRLKKNIG